MDIHKLLSEVRGDRTELVRALIARDELANLNALFKRLSKHVSFIEQEHKRDAAEELIPAHLRPELEAVLEPVHQVILLEELVEREWSQEDDGGDIVEIRYPARTHVPRSVDVVNIPLASD
jgi:hypothetical protein